jgi:hypothetical protein
VVAKQSITIYQSIAVSCLVDRGQLFGRSRSVVWSIADSCLVDRGKLLQNCLFKA